MLLCLLNLPSTWNHTPLQATITTKPQVKRNHKRYTSDNLNGNALVGFNLLRALGATCAVLAASITSTTIASLATRATAAATARTSKQLVFNAIVLFRISVAASLSITAIARVATARIAAPITTATVLATAHGTRDRTNTSSLATTTTRLFTRNHIALHITRRQPTAATRTVRVRQWRPQRIHPQEQHDATADRNGPGGLPECDDQEGHGDHHPQGAPAAWARGCLPNGRSRSETFAEFGFDLILKRWSRIDGL